MISRAVHRSPRARQEVLLRLLGVSRTHHRCLSLTSEPVTYRSRRSKVLKWTFAGASGLGFTYYMIPHVPGKRLKHTDASGKASSKRSAMASGADEDFTPSKISKDLVFVEALDVDRDGLFDNSRHEERIVEEKPWRGLSFLKSTPSFDEIRTALSSWSWPESFSSLQERASTLLLELSRGPGSLYSQIISESSDPTICPECEWDAEVRLSDDLCFSERAFLRMRKRKMRNAFARLFGVNESEIDERDLPIVAIAGSGGGFRAMVNTTGSLIGAEKTGILDCTTYMAGISGSCWALGVLYSGVAGIASPQAAATHIMERIRTSYVDASVLDMLTTPPTNKYLLSGVVHKANGPSGSPSLIDLYGTLVSTRLLIPNDLSRLDRRFLSLSHFRRNVDDGSMPLPIFTAVLHEIPTDLDAPLAEAKDKQDEATNPIQKSIATQEEDEIAERANWLWFEFTPYEVGCDDIGAWIPTWALGRRFEKGKSLDRAPELSFSILTGIFASAFCASLRHYINEVQPILKQLPFQLHDWLNEIVTENRREIGALHPVEPDEIPNFVRGLGGLLRPGTPRGITDRETIGFMDAGAELNVPYYPLFRRNVDCIIALDASADSQDLWFARAEQLAIRRGLSKWPKGARWPALLQSSDVQEKHSVDEARSTQRSTSDITNANRALAEAQESDASDQARRFSEHVDSHKDGNGTRDGNLSRGGAFDAAQAGRPKKMSACTIWMGSSTGAETGQSSLLEDIEETDLLSRDGIAIVYNPLIPNDAVPDFDPMSISTWSFSLEMEETEKLLKAAETNFMEGQEKIVRLLRAIWLRKKAERKKIEQEQKK